MNTDQTPTERQKLVAAAAESYTAPPPQSHTALMPLRDSLLTLRRKGASYRTILRILREVEIQVSLDTLARFCHEHVEQPSASKEKRRSAIRTAADRTEDTSPPVPPAPSPSDSPASAKPPEEEDNHPPARGKGPRIADPSSI